MFHLYLLYHLGYIAYDLVTFGRHPLVSAFFIAMGILALILYAQRFHRRRPGRRRR